jgi:hypothetical protein
MTRSMTLSAGTALILLASTVAVGSALGQAPPPPANLIEEVHRLYYTPVQNNILRAAEQFPEDKYLWQPTPEVRSWARLIGHLIDDNNQMCWAVAKSGSAPAFVDMPGNADSGANKMSKADLVAGLKASIERCNQTFASLTPASMTEPSGMRPGTTKIGMLIYNTSHTNEHYGNLVTYMRLQGLVPPSSAGRGGR